MGEVKFVLMSFGVRMFTFYIGDCVYGLGACRIFMKSCKFSGRITLWRITVIFCHRSRTYTWISHPGAYSLFLMYHILWHLWYSCFLLNKKAYLEFLVNSWFRSKKTIFWNRQSWSHGKNKHNYLRHTTPYLVTFFGNCHFSKLWTLLTIFLKLNMYKKTI